MDNGGSLAAQWTAPPYNAASAAKGRRAATSDGKVETNRGIVQTLIDDQRIRYLFTGGITAGVYYLIFSAGWLLSSGRIPYLLMAVIANLGTAVLTYPIYRVAVFRAGGGWVA